MIKEFIALAQAFSNSPAVAAPRNLTPPAGTPFDAEQMKQLVQAASASMPEAYRDLYAAELAQAMPEIVINLRALQQKEIIDGSELGLALRNAHRRADGLIGAAIDWQNSAVQPGLKRLAAAVGGLFRNFVTAVNSGSSAPLIERKPPLVTFCPDSVWGPSNSKCAGHARPWSSPGCNRKFAVEL